MTCESHPIAVNNTRIQITRFGDLNQIERKITFFAEPNLQGLYFSMTLGVSFGPSRTVRSYFFAGSDSWEHRAASDAVSGSCINATASVIAKGYGFTYAPVVAHQVGWVWLGCNTTQTTSTTTRVTHRPTVITTTLRATTKSSGIKVGADHTFSTVAFLVSIFIKWQTTTT